MDPLTAFSTAGTLIQFVDFTLGIIKATKELHDSSSGKSDASEELEQVTSDLSKLSVKIHRPLEWHEEPVVLSEEDKSLVDLCYKSEKIAADLLKRLDNLRVDDKREPLKHFRSALQATWEIPQLKELTARLLALRETVQLHVLVDLR